jgi:cell division protein FtsN
MNPTTPSPSHKTADLFDTTPTPSANALDAAYTEQASQPTRLGNGRWALLLLILLSINAALWFAFTSQQQAFGASNEHLAVADISPEKIAFPSSAQSPTLNPPAPPMTTSTMPAPIVEKTNCKVWEFFSSNELNKANARLAEQGWSGYVSESAQEPPTYMVFVGPFETRADMLAKIKILEKMKLKDFSPLPSTNISLGVLTTREAANMLKTNLIKRGLLGVQTIERTGKASRTRYRFDGLSADSAKALNTLSTDLGLLRQCTS